MSTVVLFVTLILLIALFALFFVCYQSQQRARQLRLAQQAAAASAANRQAAAIIFSTPVGHYPDAASPSLYDQQLVYPPQLRLQGAPRLQPQQLAPPPSFSRLYNRKTPTPRTIINNLPVVRYEACLRRPPPAAAAPPTAAGTAGGTSCTADAAVTAKGSDADDTPQCIICCCEYQAGELLKLLPCMHNFHAECIDMWLERDHMCPICQADVVLAAGLSLRDWSAHTLECVNVVSGADHAAAPAPTAAPASTTAAAEAVRQEQDTAAAGHEMPPPLPISSSSSSTSGGATAGQHGTAAAVTSPRGGSVAVLGVWPGGGSSPAAGLPGS